MPRDKHRCSFNELPKLISSIKGILELKKDVQYEILWTELAKAGLPRAKTASRSRFPWWLGRIRLFSNLSSDHRDRYCRDFIAQFPRQSEGKEALSLLPCLVYYKLSLRTEAFNRDRDGNWFSWWQRPGIGLADEMLEEMKNQDAKDFQHEHDYLKPELPQIVVTPPQSSSRGRLSPVTGTIISHRTISSHTVIVADMVTSIIPDAIYTPLF
ncbi:hypothetical protein F4820DRAFT_454806 [Hypoxylon rubiginosum]|uniref:Uncharacterized protein n=1 Tax=Hypoxylon rubiginosum TaxID=110542 RepID=A0ACB9YGA4_9PEZI|nr:hypothetical protein F4820DRAFT_454806 [Hypoxylon rubiginosum]